MAVYKISRSFYNGWKRKRCLCALIVQPITNHFQTTGRLLYTSVKYNSKDEVDTTDLDAESPLAEFKKKQTDTDNLHKAQELDLATLLKNIQKPKASELFESEPAIHRTTPMNVEEVVEFLQRENAQDICVIRIPPEKDYVEYFITCTGMGTRHIGRLADNLAAEVKHVKWDGGKGRVAVEGRDSDEWMAVDMGTMVVHVMTEEGRRRYELEKLWTLGIEYDDQCRAMLDMFDMMNERKFFR